MSFSRSALVVLTAALSSPLAARAQETQVPPAPPVETPRATTPSKPLNQNVRVDVTITLRGEPKPVVKTLTMVAADDRMSKGRATIEIPVSSAPIGSNYRNVGINVDTTPDIIDATRVVLRLMWQFTTVYQADAAGAARPSFGSGSHEAHGIVFESGKPLVITQAVDGDSGREYSVEVKATILK